MSEEADSYEELIIQLDNLVARFSLNKNEIFVNMGHINSRCKSVASRDGFLRLHQSISHKLDILLRLFIELEREVLQASLDHYEEQLLYLQDPSYNRETKIVTLFDQFLTQYFSLLDIFAGGFMQLFSPDSNIDNYGAMKNRFEKQDDFPSQLGNFAEILIHNDDFFSRLQAYRHYSIHQGVLRYDKTITGPNEHGYSLVVFAVKEVKKVGYRDYQVNENHHITINILVRESLGVLLESLVHASRSIRELESGR